jgi:hypothetical protein
MKLDCRLTKSLQSILEQRNVDEDWRQSVEDRLSTVLKAIEELQGSYAVDDVTSRKRVRTTSDNPLGMLADAASDNAGVKTVTWNDDVEEAGADPASAPGQYLSHISEHSTAAAHHHNDPHTKSHRPRHQADIIDRGLLNLYDAQLLVRLYISKLDPHAYSIVDQAHPQRDEHHRFESIRQQPLLLLAICTVAALHQSRTMHTSSQGDGLFGTLHDEFVRLSAQQSVIREQSLDDIRALLVASWWLRDISWISTGSAVRLATERGMQEAYKRCSDMTAGRRACKQRVEAGLHACSPGEAVRHSSDAFANISTAERQAYEAAKLYYLVYVADHQAAIPFARPPMTRQHAAVRNVRAWLAGCRLARREDARLAAQVELWVIAHDVVDDFGIDVQQALTRMQICEQIPRFLTLVDRWQTRWKHVLSMHSPKAADEIDFHANMMRLFVTAHTFRSPRGTDPLSINVNDDDEGAADWTYEDVEHRVSFAQRSLPQLPADTSDQTKDQRTYRYELGRRAVGTAIDLIEAATTPRSAQSVAMLFGQTIYPFSMVVFACLFLHKLSRRKGPTRNHPGRIMLPDCSTSATMSRIQRVIDMLQKQVIPLCVDEHISSTVLPGLLSLIAMERSRLDSDGESGADHTLGDAQGIVVQDNVKAVLPPTTTNIDELLTLPSSTFDGVTMTAIGTSPGTPAFNFDLQSLDLLSDLRYLSGISSDVLFWQGQQGNVQFTS